MKSETELLAEIVELKVCLIDMLEQFGNNYSMSAVENSCALLNHPRTKFYDRNENDCCYCRNVVYSKKEARRRTKLKLNFVNKTNDK